MKATQIVLALVALAGAAVGTATGMDLIHVPANLHDYVQYGADGVAGLALLGALAPFAFRRRKAAAPAVAPTTPAYKLKKQERRQTAGVTGAKYDKVEIKVPASVRGANPGDTAVLAVVPPPAPKKTVDPNAWVVYETKEGANDKVSLLVEAGPRVSGNGSVWNDKIWQPKVAKIKNIAWSEKQKGDGKFKRRGTVSKENLAEVLAALDAVNKS